MVGVGNTGIFAGLDQIIQMGVGAVCGQQHVMIQNQIITGAVTDQLVTVAIQNIAAGSFYAGDGGISGGIVDDTAGLNDLQIVHLINEKRQYQHKQQQHDGGTESAYSFHVSPPIELMPRMSGYRTGAAASVSTAGTTKLIYRAKVTCSSNMQKAKTPSS